MTVLSMNSSTIRSGLWVARWVAAEHSELASGMSVAPG